MTQNNIRILPESVKKKIAAGEVVEGPFSIVKELVENSIDAGASEIKISVLEGGMKKIQVTDNGSGIRKKQIGLSVTEHATSKIEDIYDIEQISTYGFRGEALSSISSVSRLTILSRTADEETGARLITTDAGEEISDYAGPQGTTVIVENLFYSIPARKKFLKSKRTELRYIREAVLRAALPHPEASFLLEVDNKKQLVMPAVETISRRLSQVYGNDIADNLIEEDLTDLKVRIHGFLSTPSFYKATRTMQMLFINKRPVEYRYLGFLLTRAYESMVPRGKHPAGIIFIEINPELIDVNIHPAKREVKLFDQRYIDSLIVGLVRKALDTEHRIPLTAQGNAPAAERSFPAESMGEPAAGPGHFPADTSPRARVPLQGDLLTERKNGLPLSTVIREAGELYQEIEGGPSGRKIIGGIFETYILVEEEDNELLFIDFHAAHERILYDKLIQNTGNVESQGLVFPLIIDLLPEEYRVIEENAEMIRSFGFEFSPFGEYTIQVTALPEMAGSSDGGAFFRELVEELTREGEAADPGQAIAASLACHSAKRAGDRLTGDDMRRLVNEALRDGREKRCPHGRPFVYTLGKGELEKFFRR